MLRPSSRGLPGKYVKMEDTVRSFAAILDGECDEIPEQCFRLKGGGIDDVYAEYDHEEGRGISDDEISPAIS